MPGVTPKKALRRRSYSGELIGVTAWQPAAGENIGERAYPANLTAIPLIAALLPVFALFPGGRGLTLRSGQAGDAKGIYGIPAAFPAMETTAARNNPCNHDHHTKHC